MKLKIVKIDREYWIELPDEDEPCGPYENKTAACEARIGLENFYNIFQYETE
jgi:hypothetical protein